VIWDEFRAFVHGDTLTTHIPAGEILYNYGLQASAYVAASYGTVPQVSFVSPLVGYEAGQRTFSQRDRTLQWDDSFRIITFTHIFQTTKAEFYRAFDNVVGSPSYELKGTYSYSTPPYTLLFANLRAVAVPPTRQCPARKRMGKSLLSTLATDPRHLPRNPRRRRGRMQCPTPKRCPQVPMKALA